MRMRFLICFLILPIMSLSANAGEKSSPEDLVRRAVAAPNGEARREILASLNETKLPTAEATEKYKTLILGLLKEGSKYGGGNPATLGVKGLPMRYVVQRNGDGSGKKSALLIFMHGGGDNKDVNDEQWKISTQRYANTLFPITVYPRALDDTSAVGWWEKSGYRGIMALIEEMKRSFDIDTNRIYLGGVSMGGWGAFGIGAAEADRFAGIYAEAGGFNPEYVRLINLRHTPIAIDVGEKDAKADHNFLCRLANTTMEKFRKNFPDGYKCRHSEIKGVGHVIPQDLPIKDLTWVSKFTRDPYPKKIVWEHASWWEGKKGFYWLRVAEHETGMRIEAEILDGNKIAVKTKGVTKGFTIFLNDRLVDLAKPVTVDVDGQKKFTAVVVPTLAVLTETLIERADPEMFFTARIDIR